MRGKFNTSFLLRSLGGQQINSHLLLKNFKHGLLSYKLSFSRENFEKLENVSIYLYRAD